MKPEIKQKARVRLDHRGTGTIVRIVDTIDPGDHTSKPYALVRWDNYEESWEWVANLLLA